MGQNAPQQVENRSDIKVCITKINIPFEKRPQKVYFNYMKPIDVDQDQLGSMQSFGSLQDLRQKDQEQQPFDSKLLETISFYKSIKQIKVKWNSFIKIKQKNYLQQYEIIKKVIGKGGFGVVRKVKSKYSNEIRVAKIIQKSIMKQDDIKKLFTQLCIMRTLDNPNIIKLFQVYDFEQQFTLIIQMCTGGQVYSKTKRKKMGQKKAGNIIKQLLRCLIYMHNQKITHRDIKPENLLFENEEQKIVKLIDFGIARKIQEGEFLDERIGTPGYISPEVIYKKYTEKCDIWATGIMFYEFLAGRTPFQGQSDLQILREILRAEISFQGPVWQKVSEECKSVIKLMLTKKQQNRPSAKQLFDHAFFLNLQGQKSQNHSKNQAINNIHKFRFKNKLQAVVQTFIAAQLLTKQQKQALVQIFRQFDSNNDGVISTDQLRQALSTKKKMSTNRLQTMMRIIDINGSGQIDYTQFLVANCDSSVQLTKQRLKHVFQYFDTDRNGKITYEQVAQFLQDYQSSQEEIRKIFLLVDVNNDGSISQDQFIDLLIKKAHQIASIHQVQDKQKLLLQSQKADHEYQQNNSNENSNNNHNDDHDSTENNNKQNINISKHNKTLTKSRFNNNKKQKQQQSSIRSSGIRTQKARKITFNL